MGARRGAKTANSPNLEEKNPIRTERCSLGTYHCLKEEHSRRVALSQRPSSKHAGRMLQNGVISSKTPNPLKTRGLATATLFHGLTHTRPIGERKAPGGRFLMYQAESLTGTIGVILLVTDLRTAGWRGERGNREEWNNGEEGGRWPNQ